MLKISVVTVCYNMEQYIEQTILSILNQNYPNLEYIIIDGGSTDKTCDIIRKYRDRIAYFVSEPDKGMYDAINKGFSHATGDIVAWLNADDLYMPWTLDYVNLAFSSCPEVEWISGIPSFLDNKGIPSRIYTYPGAKNRKDIMNGRFCANDLGCLQQEGMFWKKSLYDRAGGLDTELKYAGDYDLWIRFARETELYSVCVPLAMFRQRTDSLSASSDKYEKEVALVRAKYGIKRRLINHNNVSERQSRILKVIQRLSVRRKSPLLVYSPKEGKMEIVRQLRHVACYSLQDARIFAKQE